MPNRKYHNFPSKVFSLTLPKNFVGDLSLSDNFSGFEKKFHQGDITVFSKGGGSTVFRRLFFSQSTEICVGEPSRFH